MKKARSSRSGFFRPRIVVSLAFCSIGILLALLAFAVYPGATLAQVQPSSQDSNEVIKGVTMHGEPGITETVEQIMERENKRPNSR